MSTKAKVQKKLEVSFGINKVKHTKEGFKINYINLREAEIKALDTLRDFVLSTEVKRSGTGIVVIINLYPEDRD